MSHGRKTIRSAIATLLAASPSAWSQVVETRIQSQRQIWPYLMVFSESEDSDDSVVNLSGIYSRNLIVSVVGLLRLPGTGDTQTIEDKMDTMAAEIETKLTHTTLGAVVSAVKSVSLIASRMDVIIEDDGVDHAELNLSWRVNYYTAEGSPETLI